jgi:6-phosphogluconolactonase (cycloisomerase 2 family)
MKRTRLHITATLTILFTLFSISALAQGRFVYTNNDRTNNNSITGFTVKADGRLEILPGMPVQTGDGGGSQNETLRSRGKIVATTKGPYLFAANDEEQTITVFKINPDTGALTFVETEDIGGGNNEDSIALIVSPDENFLYAANPSHDRIHALRIFDDGQLAEIEVEQLAEGLNPLDMQVSPDGKFLAVEIFQGLIDIEGRLAMFSIGNIGQLEPVPGSPFKASNAGGIGQFRFNCDGSLLFMAKRLVNKLTIDVFSISTEGNPSLMDGAPFVFYDADMAVNLAMTPNGKYLYAAGGFSNMVHAMTIKPGGQLEVVLFSPFPTTYQSHISRLTPDAEGRRLFVTYSDQRVEPLIIEANGSLSTIPDSLVGTNEDNGGNQSFLNSLAAFPLPKNCQIKVPDDITINNAQFVCGNDVDYVASICGNDCGGTVTCKPPSGTFFPVGTTTITCSAEGLDDAQFTITVKDIDAPKISCPEDITVATEPNKCSAKVNFKVSATDFCDANPIIEIDLPSGTEFPKGTTTVHIKATDNAGNFSNCIFTVKVVDQQAPSINCAVDVTVNNAPDQCGAAVNYQLPTASDNCPDVGAVSCNPPSGTFFPIGATTVTCTVKDASNNSSQCSFKVTVKDTQAPAINCPADKIAATATPCDAGLVVNYPAPMVSDNCPNNLLVVCTPASGAVFPVGATTVTCKVTDGGGNQAECSFKVTIFNVWLQDDANPANVLLFNSNTGEYRLCYAGVNQPVTGIGMVMKKGCSATLQHNPPDRRLTASVDAGTNKGTASYQSPPGSLKATITDKNVTNNTNLCP